MRQKIIETETKHIQKIEVFDVDLKMFMMH